MFFGTTPSVISQYISKQLHEIKPKRVFVPFAGNFVIEQLVGLYDKSVECHSTDVMLYSIAIGFGAMGHPFYCKIKAEYLEMFPFFENKTSPLETAANVIYFNELAKYMGKQEHPYYSALINESLKTLEADYEKIMNKLTRFKLTLGNFIFHGIDACELIKDVRENDFVFYDPTYLTNGYEKLYKFIDDIFDWQKPDYTLITDEIKDNLLYELDQKGAKVYYRSMNQVPINFPYEQIYHYQYKYNLAYCLYSNIESNKFVGRWKPLKDCEPKYKLIDAETVITEKSSIGVHKVVSAVVNHYRMLWVKKADMVDSGISFIITIDGKMIGCCQIKPPIAFGTEWAVIFSDPACPYSKYLRLSKLILYLICTKTMLKEINDISLWENKGFTTRVYTNNPVSMKYRGLFDLTERSKDDGNYEYKLIYKSKKLFKNYKTALNEWLKKDGKKLKQ